MIEKKDSRIVTRPIGGTYQRNQDGNDGSVIEQFLRDPKEVAEHNMLVDLERNDLSTICKPGSVRIERFQEVEEVILISIIWFPQFPENCVRTSACVKSLVQCFREVVLQDVQSPEQWNG